MECNTVISVCMNSALTGWLIGLRQCIVTSNESVIPTMVDAKCNLADVFKVEVECIRQIQVQLKCNLSGMRRADWAVQGRVQGTHR
jgi:hypothetical protein